jgi:hypothetical protein
MVFQRSQLHGRDSFDLACHRFETKIRRPQSTKHTDVSERLSMIYWINSIPNAAQLVSLVNNASVHKRNLPTLPALYLHHRTYVDESPLENVVSACDDENTSKHSR